MISIRSLHSSLQSVIVMAASLPPLSDLSPASPRHAADDPVIPLPPHIHSWLAAIFHPHPIPSFENDPTSIAALTQLHSLTRQRQQLSRLLEEDVQSKLVEYQQDNQYKAAMLAAVSMLPSSLKSALPASNPSLRPHATFTPSASLSSSLSALTSLAQQLSLHSVDEPVMVAALTAHKLDQQARHYQQQHFTHDIQHLHQQVQHTQHAITTHTHLLHQLTTTTTATQTETTNYTTQLHTYQQKHKEYNNRLQAAQHKLTHSNTPTLSRLLAVRDEVSGLEGRLERLVGEVGVWDGLSSDVRVARRQVVEAEMEVARLEEEIERRLCVMSAFE